MTQPVARPVALLIMDGWGYREETEHNAILAANTPNFDRLRQDYAWGLIGTSGHNVGLPSGQMGNSEVGHLNLGSGRVVYQDYTRIGAAIDNGHFVQNAALLAAMDGASEGGKSLHLMGLLSPGGVHSHEDHFIAAINLAAERGVKSLYVHAMLDGRDTPPRSAKASLERLEKAMAEAGVGRIATLVGRYYAMDRDNRWDRVEKAFDLYTGGEAEHQADSPVAGLEAAYARDENDEFVPPTQIGAKALIDDGDAVLFMNFRADRAREITQAFTAEPFDGFERKRVPTLHSYTTMTEYHKDFDVAVAFPPDTLPNVLGEYVSGLGLRQLRIAETEKYAHVTFFFNGGVEQPYEGEERVLVPSPRVATYDLQPEMNAPIVATKLVDAIEADTFDLIVCNFANADMVGHTGNFDAAVKAIEALDGCLGRVAEALKKAGGELIMTADHGNAEKMQDESTGQAHTAHTTFDVPFVYMGREADIKKGGVLSDVAPTLLHMMGVDIPKEMTGQSLLSFK
ncbi:MAG: 2,3-bisphosphoglycerate-independent phosphoglycerate mutase [Gammaproteobacteria bacterium]